MIHWELSSYDNNGWKCKLHETSTTIANFFLNLKAPFVNLHVFKKIIIIFNVHTREKKITKQKSLMYTMYNNASNNTPYVSSCVL